MNDDDSILEPLARAETPPLDPARRDRIEAGLRVAHAGRTGVPVRRPRWIVALPAVVVMLLLATFVLLAGDEGTVAALEVRDAREVVITLPTGETVRDPADGYRLLDGAVIVVGDRGTITVDDVTFGGGARVTVRDGRLVPESATTTTTTIGRSRGPATTIVAPQPSDRDEPAERTPTTTTTTPTVTRPLDGDPDDRPPTDSRPTGTERPPTTTVVPRDGTRPAATTTAPRDGTRPATDEGRPPARPVDS